LLVIYIKFSGISNEESVKCGERGVLRVAPALGRGDNGKGKEIPAFAGMTRGIARMTRKDAGMTSRGKLAGTNSHKSFRLL